MKVSLFNVTLSMFMGIGGACVSSPAINALIVPEYQSIVIAIIAILSDKIAEFFIYKFNIEIIITAFLNTVIGLITKNK